MKDILGSIIGILLVGLIMVTCIEWDISDRNETKLVNIKTELKDLEEKYLD